MPVLRNLLRNRADADTLSYAVFDAWQHNNKNARQLSFEAKSARKQQHVHFERCIFMEISSVFF